jgi:hypothetical protein
MQTAYRARDGPGCRLTVVFGIDYATCGDAEGESSILKNSDGGIVKLLFGPSIDEAPGRGRGR